VIGLVTARRQRRRLRITPNTNTTTTTMISTHNHVDMAASLVGAGAGQADTTTAAHPGKQLPRVQATSRAGIDGRAARAHGRPCTPRPARRSGLIGWGQPRPGHRPRAGPGGAEPFGPRPASQPIRIDQHHMGGGPGRRQPTRPDPSEPDRRGMARPRSVCPAWVGEQSKHGCAETQWQTRHRRRTDGARLRRNPNLRRGRLHRPALPVQPRSMLRDPPRVGPAGGASTAATPPLSCRGPMVSSTRSPRLTARIRQHGHGRG
jgi:hypothetical protein